LIAYTRKTNAILYGSTSALNIGRGGAVNEQQLSLFKPGQIISLGSFTVQVIASKHSPGNALKDDGVIIKSPLRQPVNMKAYSEGGSFDFYIKHNGRTIYVKPSPNYIEDALDSLKAEVVLIGIGTIGNKAEDWQNKHQETVNKLNPLVIPLIGMISLNQFQKNSSCYPDSPMLPRKILISS
jgi:L-ascorbate metabolism protein UlaG (beta-lactamase superfamily)